VLDRCAFYGRGGPERCEEAPGARRSSPGAPAFE
jgi:hypothetical protein